MHMPSWLVSGGVSPPAHTIVIMLPTPATPDLPAPAVRLAEAQAAIRRLTARCHLTREQRLELAAWQRQWVAAWRESQYAIAA